MTRVVIVCWVVCIALAVSHLLFLAAYQFAPGFWLAVLVLLACYSVPFFLLTRFRLPPHQPMRRGLIMALAFCVIAVNAFIPLRRFLPGYRPEALESLIYLAVPLPECLPIVVALTVL